MLELSAIAGLFGLAAAGAIWSGYVLTILWGWFVIPVFGLPGIAIAPAIGLSIVAHFLTHQYIPKAAKPSDDGKWSETGRAVASMVFKPLFALLVGWVAKQWM